MDGTERTWFASYPPGVPRTIDPASVPTLVRLFEDSFARNGPRVALTCLGANLLYSELDRDSAAFAAWLQSRGVAPGDRVAIMTPNVLHFPIAFAGALRAGAVAVNVNPLYTAKELEHQLRDAGAQTIVVLENFAHTVAAVAQSAGLRNIVVCSLGEMYGFPKGLVVDFVVRHVKGMVKPYSLPGSVRFRAALAAGRGMQRRPVDVKPGDLAVLQYTGGTTGVSKGAMLLHSNLVANVLQIDAWSEPCFRRIPNGEPPCFVTALPLYHIFALTACLLSATFAGGRCILIANPRDFASVVKALRGERFHVFPAVNTLFNALCDYEPFRQLDFSHLVRSVGGGMAVQEVVARRWKEMTGSAICEGYGLSESSPVATCNPADITDYTGTIGIPLSSTDVAILDDAGRQLPVGQEGEIGIRGPQVMAGYWKRPDETAKVMTAEGWLRTGDIGVMDERGYTRIVDRKKDMILVSGFKVFPNEVEAVVSSHPGVAEVAAIGVPDPHSGEVVKLFVVRRDPALRAEDLLEYCRENLSGYKRPRSIEFRTELPKSNVGKILRRELRETSRSAASAT